jgi:glycosyltransferase involved in cell wall biosynthesis
MNSSVIQVCIGYAPKTGGTTRSVNNFRSVIKTGLIAFVDPDWFHGIATISPEEDISIVPIPDSWLGRKYGYVSESNLKAERRLIEESKLLICHMLWRHHMEWATRIARQSGVPYWVIPHGSMDPYALHIRSLRKRIWMETVGRRILSHAARVIFATDREREKAELTGVKMNSTVINWPVSPINIPVHLAQRDAIRVSLGIPLDAKVLIYLGRLHSMKRPLETVKAVCRIDDPNVHLILCGPDDTITAKECLDIAPATRRGNIHPIGAVYDDKKFDYMLAADAFILLSERENFSYAVADAMMCGLPVIATRNVDLVSMIEDFHCGWFTKDLSDAEADVALRAFAEAPAETIKAMGRNGLEYAENSLTNEKFEERVLGLASTDMKI